MTTLAIAASRTPGRPLLEQLLQRGEQVKAIVRTPGTLIDCVQHHEGYSEIQASVHDLTVEELQQHVTGCDAVASCLGHQMSLKGVFGKPRLLVTDTVRRLCEAIQATHSGQPAKFVLMNTAGNSNRDLQEPVSFAQQCVIGLLRLLVPPHPDNEKAADYLRTQVGQNNPAIEWAAVRPDALQNESEVTEYELHPSPTRSAIFNSGKTSRINVAHFMAELVTNQETWHQWKGQMPVIYNKVE
ncbi:MAG: SDR family oxidoreductase [Planctomycetaceae bacterium]|nr:SDR family oxidoreductase [Planctomycetaceae bacterium]